MRCLIIASAYALFCDGRHSGAGRSVPERQKETTHTHPASHRFAAVTNAIAAKQNGTVSIDPVSAVPRYLMPTWMGVLPGKLQNWSGLPEHSIFFICGAFVAHSPSRDGSQVTPNEWNFRHRKRNDGCAERKPTQRIRSSATCRR